MGVHMKDKRYKCDMCDFSAHQMGDLNRHKAKHSENRPFPCPQCPSRFKQKNNLNTHIARHTGQKRFKCEHCDFHAINMAGVRQHMTSHTENRPFECVTCQQGFKTASGLHQHEQSHSIMRFNCLQCSFITHKAKLLKIHISVTHREVRAFACDVCGKYFKTPQAVKVHKRGHDGVKTIKCSLCPYMSFTESRLRRHEKTHKQYNCGSCDFTTCIRAELREHKLKQRHA